MKKNTKIILGSVIGIAVLGAATLALVPTTQTQARQARKPSA